MTKEAHTEVEFDVAELAARAGVTPRTIYYYAQQGLIPPAAGTGPGPKYGRSHLLRLRLIRRLQAQHLPLAEIASRLKALSDDDVQRLLEEQDSRRGRKNSALDYVRSVLSEDSPRSKHTIANRTLFARRSPQGDEDHVGPGSPSAPMPAISGERSQWERIGLADGIELHVRRPMTRAQQKSLERLMWTARKIFEEEQT